MRVATKQLLPADVFDMLATATARHGGVGGYIRFKNGAPYCMLGYATDLDGGLHGPVTQGLFRVGFNIQANDDAVKAINARLPWWRRAFRWRFARVPFAEWCAEFGVERGA